MIKNRQAKWVMAGLLVVGCVTVLYMTTGLQTAYQLTQYQRGQFSEPERLTAVWNPWFWGDRQALYRHSVALKTALAEQDVVAIQEYIGWSAPVIARLPRTTLLHNHLVALFAVEKLAAERFVAGRLEEADALVARLRLEYPNTGLFREAAVDKLKAQLAAGEVPRVFESLTPPVGSATYY